MSVSVSDSAPQCEVRSLLLINSFSTSAPKDNHAIYQLDISGKKEEVNAVKKGQGKGKSQGRSIGPEKKDQKGPQVVFQDAIGISPVRAGVRASGIRETKRAQKARTQERYSVTTVARQVAEQLSATGIKLQEVLSIE